MALLMGAVAYDPKVVTIWDGLRDGFATRALDFDYVLYPYDGGPVEALVRGHLHVSGTYPTAGGRASCPAPRPRSPPGA